MRRLRFALVFAVALGVFASSQGSAQPVTGPTQWLERATVDRPDDNPGFNVHVVDVLLRGNVDHRLDGGKIQRSVLAADQWIYLHSRDNQGNGLSINWDTYQGRLDVSLLRLTETQDQLFAAKGYPPDRIGQKLAQAGFNKANTVYVLVIDTGSPYVPVPYLGLADWPPTVPGFPGHVTAMEICSAACVNELSADNPEPDLVLVHEVFHALGLVPSCAAHQSNGHVTDDPKDLMFVGGYTDPSTANLDIGHDDYLYRPGCPGLESSPYVAYGAYAVLDLAADGTGSGAVRTGGGACVTGPCSFAVPRGLIVLTAIPDGDSVFKSWNGACSGSSPTCTIAVSGNISVRATFGLRTVLPKWRLKVRTAGKGGRIRVTSVKMRCVVTANGCSFPSGTRVTLKEILSKGWHFVRWSGSPGCSTKPTCVVAVTANRTVTATFAANKK